MSEAGYWNKVYDAGRYVRGEIPQDSSPFAKAVLPQIKEAIAAQLAAQRGTAAAAAAGAAATASPAAGDGAAAAAGAQEKGADESSSADEERQLVVWEWGCGNGRDATFFASEGLRVVGLDIADHSIAALNKQHAENKNLVFATNDFTDGTLKADAIIAGQSGPAPEKAPTAKANFVVGVVYSRFTVHSVKEEGASRAYAWAFANLNAGGLLCIETRSVKDKLCGVGTQVEGERHAWIEDHYRRFTVADELKAELTRIGFVIDTVQEDTGLAVYKEEDPCVLRIVARKP